MPALIGATGVSAITTVKSLYDLIKTKKNEGRMIAEDAVKEKVSEMNKTPNYDTLTDKEKIDDAVANSNNVKDNHEAYRMNCSNVVATYEMRRRGYDVTAKPRLTPVNSNTEYLKYFDKIKFSKLEDSSKKVRDELSKMPEGSRGCIRGTWTQDGIPLAGCGHIFNWEVQNGKVVFADAQIGKQGQKVDEYLDSMTLFSYARLDNLKVSDNISEVLRSRGSV